MKKKQRNEDIYRKREYGATFTDLAIEYGISITRVRQIYYKLKRMKGENK